MHPCPSPSRLLFLSSWPHYRNAGLPTIEEELLKALSEVGAIKKDFNLGQLGFQRCSRTDKGVSAARQVVSLKISVCLLYVHYVCVYVVLAACSLSMEEFSFLYTCHQCVDLLGR